MECLLTLQLIQCLCGSGFPLGWPDNVALPLGAMKVANFDISLALFDCSLLDGASDHVNFMFKWTLIVTM